MTDMRNFCVADLNAKGEVTSSAEYDYSLLEQIPGALDLIVHFSTWVWRSPDEFEVPLPSPRCHLTWRWLASAPTAGIATLRSRQDVITVSFLATGIDDQADKLTLDSFQHHLLRELHDTGIEPAFDLTALARRPLVATINLFDPEQSEDLPVVALADRCFAAAYFRYHRLA
jgi:hypothetical protein